MPRSDCFQSVVLYGSDASSEPPVADAAVASSGAAVPSPPRRADAREPSLSLRSRPRGDTDREPVPRGLCALRGLCVLRGLAPPPPLLPPPPLPTRRYLASSSSNALLSASSISFLSRSVATVSRSSVFAPRPRTNWTGRGKRTKRNTCHAVMSIDWETPSTTKTVPDGGSHARMQT